MDRGIYGFMSLTATVATPFASVTAAHRAWTLASFGYRHDQKYQCLKQKLKWAFLSAIAPRVMLEWFDLLDNHEMRTFAKLNPRLAFKPMRVYMSTGWDKSRRIKVIKDTYSIIERKQGALLEALTGKEGALLASFDLEGYGESKIVLGYDVRFRKEGELVASLRCGAAGTEVVSMAFSFERLSDGSSACYVGCVQGGGQDDTKQVAKAMHGLRPKALMVFVAQQIASATGAAKLYGVGNTIQAHLQKHFIHKPSRHNLALDYDSIWIEAGGEQTEDRWFSLPLEFQRRPAEAIKANKRGMYNRRYALMDGLSEQIRARLSV